MNDKNQTPGPTQYDPNLRATVADTPKIGFNKAGRQALDSNQKNNYPSPGEYIIPKSKSVGTKFGKAKTVNLGKKSKDGPSPGAYTIPSIFSSNKKKGITMGKRYKKKKGLSSSVGPGAYDPDYTLTKKTAIGSK